MNKFNDKFETDATHNSSCLTADGCFKRHEVARKDEFLTKDENARAELRTFSREEGVERRLISKVAYLQKIGCQLKPDESLEAYVRRNAFRFHKEA